MEIYGPLIDQQFSERINMKTATGVPFQILGFDVLIDSALKCWLLEINHSPSMNIYFDSSKNPMEKVEMTDADICPVDFHVKSRVATDTIMLASSQNLVDVDQLNSMQRIHPLRDDS